MEVQNYGSEIWNYETSFILVCLYKKKKGQRRHTRKTVITSVLSKIFPDESIQKNETGLEQGVHKEKIGVEHKML
jgi:hypothetical protein